MPQLRFGQLGVAMNELRDISMPHTSLHWLYKHSSKRAHPLCLIAVQQVTCQMLISKCVHKKIAWSVRGSTFKIARCAGR